MKGKRRNMTKVISRNVLGGTQKNSEKLYNIRFTRSNSWVITVSLYRKCVRCWK
jgi:hypothetical protein